jgi:hypothetical protein
LGDLSASPKLGLGYLLHHESHDWRLRRLWHTSRDGSTNASGRLPPRPSRALTSINAARNHDFTPHRDAEAPRKQAFTHTTTLLQQQRYGQPLTWGLRHTTNPSPLPRLSLGNQRTQVNNAVHRHVGLQGTMTSPHGIQRPQDSQHTTPTCINREV